MFPLTDSHLQDALHHLGIADPGTATIRQIVALASALEAEAGEPFVRLELGNPGIPAQAIGIEAQREALAMGVAMNYPDITGIPELKKQGSRFMKAFYNLDIPPRGIVPTVGSMQGSFTLQLLLGSMDPERNAILFIDPGFSAQHHQARVLGLEQRSFDLYHYRGEKLHDKLLEMTEDGRVAMILYSNPNNPAWVNLTDEELRAIASVADKRDIVIIEDLAYMGMDFRSDFSKPYEPPYIPTVSRYTDRVVMLISASKIFSYAGERIAMVVMNDAIYSRHCPRYEKLYGMDALGDAYIYSFLYSASSGTCHSAQHAFAAMLRAAVDGKLDFVDASREYGRRAAMAKKAFLDNGFVIVYDKDGDKLISDGFFFTVGRDGMTGTALQRELLKYGISTIPLSTTGSRQEGVRVTVSMVNDDNIPMLTSRLQKFNEAHR